YTAYLFEAIQRSLDVGNTEFRLVGRVELVVNLLRIARFPAITVGRKSFLRSGAQLGIGENGSSANDENQQKDDQANPEAGAALFSGRISRLKASGLRIGRLRICGLRVRGLRIGWWRRRVRWLGGRVVGSINRRRLSRRLGIGHLNRWGRSSHGRLVVWRARGYGRHVTCPACLVRKACRANADHVAGIERSRHIRGQALLVDKGAVGTVQVGNLVAVPVKTGRNLRVMRGRLRICNYQRII